MEQTYQIIIRPTLKSLVEAVNVEKSNGWHTRGFVFQTRSQAVMLNCENEKWAQVMEREVTSVENK